MRRLSWPASITVLLTLQVTACIPAGTRPVPVQSEIMAALEHGDAEGLTDTYMSGSLPLSETDLIGLAQNAPPDFTERYPLLRAYDDPDLVRNRSLAYTPAWPAHFRLLYVDGERRTEKLAGTQARVVGPLNLPNDYGRGYGSGFNMDLGTRVVSQLYEGLVVTVQPEFRWRESGDPTGDEADATELEILQANVRLEMGHLELEVGRDSIWWGPGRHGALLMSTNAPPLDLVRLRLRRPILLPSFLQHLGPVKFDTFISRLGANRTVPEPLFGGMRLELKPHPNLTLGASRTFMWGGDGRDESWDTFEDVLLARHENDPLIGPGGNQLGAVDARWRIPWSVQPVVIYAEYGGEDEAGNFPSKHAVLGGIYLPRLGPLPIQVRAEYVDTFVERSPRVWYNHSLYRSGYTHEGHVIGHHVGTDADELSLEVGLPLGDETELTLRTRHGRRNLSNSAPVEYDRFQATWRMRLHRVPGRPVLRALLGYDLFDDRLSGIEDAVTWGGLHISWPF